MKIIKGILLLVVLVAVFLVGRHLVSDKRGSQNTQLSTSQVPQGTFKNMDTGEIFTYTDNWGYIDACQKVNCKYVYFDITDQGTIAQIREASLDPLFGKIVKVTPQYESQSKITPTELPNQAEYLIAYQYNGKNYQSTYIHNLCVSYKSGGKQCYAPAKTGSTASIILSPNSSSVIDQITTFNKVLKAELLNVKNVDHE